MKRDIILAGVGGQGILSIAAVICSAAVRSGFRIKQSEVHGMAQRGGAAQAHVRIAAQPIHSDLIPLGAADLILAMEPLEALRYLPWLAPHGRVISNAETIRNTAAYPPDEAVLAGLRAEENTFLFDATAIARDLGQPRAVNMALLGAAATLLPYPAETLERAIRDIFAAKGSKVIDVNLAIFHAGCAAAEECAGKS